jgi:hypothetical protein
MSEGDWHLSRSRQRRRSASAKASASGAQRLKACEQLRSHEVPTGWADHDPCCHGGFLPSSQQPCCRVTLGAQDRHRAFVILQPPGADFTDSGASLSIVCAVPLDTSFTDGFTGRSLSRQECCIYLAINHLVQSSCAHGSDSTPLCPKRSYPYWNCLHHSPGHLSVAMSRSQS